MELPFSFGACAHRGRLLLASQPGRYPKRHPGALLPPKLRGGLQGAWRAPCLAAISIAEEARFCGKARVAGNNGKEVDLPGAQNHNSVRAERRQTKQTQSSWRGREERPGKVAGNAPQCKWAGGKTTKTEEPACPD